MPDALPPIHYPEDLPVSGRREDILAALRSHQVVVVAGATGSGKTTQLPKMLLELGKARIAHTQPRRIAARSVAERVAEELGVSLGGLVGYKVRFTDQVSRATRVAVMTDGILLNEIHRDPDLRRYDAIVIDEAHERSLTVDFLLGYLKRLLPRRPDLTVVVTSATIDPESFARHFAVNDVPAPVVEVSGRTYPVEIRYRPLVPDAGPEGSAERVNAAGDKDGKSSLGKERGLAAASLSKDRGRATASLSAATDDADDAGPDDTEPNDVPTAILDALRELEREPPGDVLVFLSGEAEIRDAMDAIQGARLRGTEVLPLYGRLSAAEQHRVFEAPPPGTRRRVILSTNVAETSLTVPGIRYVIDEGTARISRWSARSKVQRLPIEPISQASAAQRAGRSGRLAPGIAIRLYAEDDFMRRPEYTEPEILRTDLAAVLLQMAVLDLGDIADFPFLEPPDRRGVRDGMQLLQELGAIDRDGDVTRLGRELSRIPLDPRLGRMLLAARELGVLEDVLPIVAGLSIQDPRERPEAAREVADRAHRRHADSTSDFVTLLRLWRHLEEQQATLSGNAFRKLLKTEYLSYLRVREWQDVVRQLRQVLDLPRTAPARETVDAERVHKAILAGLLSRIGVKAEPAKGADPREKRRRTEYLGARNARFAIHPSSALARKGPDAVMAAELVETSRLFARTVAAIDPAWAEEWARDLVVRNYSEPRWDARRGEAVADERVTLYGVPIVPRRRIRYARIDPDHARELFIRHALVAEEGEEAPLGPVAAFDRLPRSLTAFHRANAEVRARLAELEERSRRRDLTLDDEAFVAWYRARIPIGVDSTREFERWWRREREASPDLLTMREEEFLSGEEEGEERGAGFPEAWDAGGRAFPILYRHAPGAADDGVTVVIPREQLAGLDPTPFGWLVPGLREELVAALIKTLPKVLRREVVPAGDWARRLLPDLPAEPHGSLTEQLAAVIKKATFAPVTAGDFDESRLPDHLRMNFRITAAPAPPPRIREKDARDEAGSNAGSPNRGARRPDSGRSMTGRPDVLGEGRDLRALQERFRVAPAQRAAAARAATAERRVAAIPAERLEGTVRYVLEHLSREEKLALAVGPYPSPRALAEDAARAVLIGGGELSPDALLPVVALAARILTKGRDVEKAIKAATTLTLVGPLGDAKAQLAALIHPGFIQAAGLERLPRIPVYLDGILLRVQKLPESPGRDRVRQSEIEHATELYRRAGGPLPLAPETPPGLARVRWLLEELRLSLFAQTLPTSEPVSVQRIQRAITEAAART